MPGRPASVVELDPAFADYMGEAFKLLGVYLNFFQPKLSPGTQRILRVLLVNDEHRAADGTLSLVLEDASGGIAGKNEQAFTLPALGDRALDVPLTIPPGLSGRFTLKAIAQAHDPTFGQPTQSRRWVTVVSEP